MTESPQPTLLFALVSGQLGGGQRVALSVARAVVGHGGRIAAIAPDDGPVLQEFRSLGARTFVAGRIRSYDLAKIVSLARIIRETRASCVYTHSVPVHEAMLALAAHATKTRLVIHRHALGCLSPRRAARAYQRSLWRHALQSADEVVCVSAQVRAQVLSMGRSEAHLVPNGIPVSKLPEPLPSDGHPMVGFVGRLDRNKRVEDFIAAASLIRRHQPDARFVVAGGGADTVYTEYCRDLAARLELGKLLTFLGPVLDAQQVLRALDVLVLPSVLEGHPLVLLEAMALGRPVVATDIPGCREIVRDGVDGLLVPARNPEAIAAAVIGLLKSPEERVRLGAAGHARVREDFSEGRMLSRLLPLLIGT